MLTEINVVAKARPRNIERGLIFCPREIRDEQFSDYDLLLQFLECVGGVIDRGLGEEIGESTSNYRRILHFHLHSNNLGNNMNSPAYGINSKTFI